MSDRNIKPYQIEIIETLSKTIIVKAESRSEAMQKVKGMYYNEEVILDADDHVDTSFKLYFPAKVHKPNEGR